MLLIFLSICVCVWMSSSVPFFKLPFWHWKDRTELERDKVREKVRFMFMALHLYGCLLCLCVVVSVIKWGCMPKGCSVCISIRDSVRWDQDKRGENGVGWVWQRKASASQTILQLSHLHPESNWNGNIPASRWQSDMPALAY